MLGIPLPRSEARSLLCGIGEQPTHLPGVETRRATGSGGRAEGSGDGVRAPVTLDHVLQLAESGRDAAKAKAVPGVRHVVEVGAVADKAPDAFWGSE